MSVASSTHSVVHIPAFSCVASVSVGLYTSVFPFTHPLKYCLGQFQIAYVSTFRSETNVSIVIASTGRFTNQRFMVNKLTEKMKKKWNQKLRGRWPIPLQCCEMYMLHTVSVGRHVIGNTDQYTKLSCAVEQLNRAAATDLLIFSRKIRGWKERQLLCEEKSIFLV